MFVVGTAVTPVVPTTSGGVAGFTVTPALPAGLYLNSSNGTISGTLSAVTPAAIYTISASANGASVSTNVSITVGPQPSYGAAAITFTTGVAANSLTPAVAGGAAPGWSISPALPPGLTFDTNNGTISGTPTGASPPTTYTVTAKGTDGQWPVTVTIEVDSSTLLDLGHQGAIEVSRMSGSTVLSVDQFGHWNLWDYASAAEIASGDVPCDQSCQNVSGDVAGGIAVLANQSGFEVISATTGQVLANISASSVAWWKLATDGSYIVAGTQTGLFAWSTSGRGLMSLSGNYQLALAFAAPGEVELANSPAGQNVIQTISVPGGAATTSGAFNGQFGSWFLDGNRFFTTAGTTTLVYSQAVVQQAAITLPTIQPGAPITGQGNWLWTIATNGTLEVFPIATGSTPAASFTTDIESAIVPSATTIGLSHESGQFSVIDLSGATPSEADYTRPVNSGEGATYAAESASQWILGNIWGVLVDGASLTGTPRYFDYGMAWSIAGSNGSIAVSTASGRIVCFDAATLTEEGTIPDRASTVRLSADGTVLAAAGDENDAQYNDDWSVRIYSLPGASLLYTWPYSFANHIFPKDIELSASGTVLGQVLVENGWMLQANPPTGGAAMFSSNYASVQADVPGLLISPNGTLIATSTTGPTTAAGANIYTNGSLTTAVSGWPVGWIDDGHLLVNRYVQPHLDVAYGGCRLLDPSGQSAGSCALSHEVDSFQPVTSDTIYSSFYDSIISVSTGNSIWMSGDPTSLQRLGAVAGNHVVFVTGAHVIAQGY